MEKNFGLDDSKRVSHSTKAKGDVYLPFLQVSARKTQGSPNNVFAERIVLRTKAKILKGSFHSRARSTVARTAQSLSQFAEYFSGLMRNSLRESTLSRIYGPAFKNFISICGDKQLSGYSVRDVEEFKSKRLKKHSPTTVNIEFRTLKAAFNHAVKWEFIAENPFTKSSKVRVPEKAPVYFSREDFLKFLGVVRESHLRDLFLFAAQTGLRRGELLNLKCTEIDLERKIIRVTSNEGFTTKTGKSRGVPMNETVFELIKRLRSIDNVASFVFHHGGQQFSPNYISHKFKKYVRAAGLNDELKFHSLRHTFATWLVQTSVSLYEVQKLLGHTDIKTTQIYAHLMAEELHSTVNKISFEVRKEIA